jgi:hypothetical protein
MEDNHIPKFVLDYKSKKSVDILRRDDYNSNVRDRKEPEDMKLEVIDYILVFKFLDRISR